jgi:hypothetical protein
VPFADGEVDTVRSTGVALEALEFLPVFLADRYLGIDRRAVTDAARYADVRLDVTDPRAVVVVAATATGRAAVTRIAALDSGLPNP